MSTLHNLQVVILGSNAANKYQSVYQHQAGQGNVQELLKYTDEVDKKMSRAGELEHKAESQEIKENDRHNRQWKKEPENEEKRRDTNKKAELEKEKKDSEKMRGADHIIDLKA